MNSPEVDRIVTIIPGEHPPSDMAMLTSGTRVVLASGEQLPAVTRIHLYAEPGDVWRADISCFAEVKPIRAEAKITRSLAAWPWHGVDDYCQWAQARSAA